MNVLVYLVAALLCFILAYRLYGRFIEKSIGVTPNRPTPATELQDGRDYVPTRPSVLFAHHYSTIAGAGPIVGPTLGILFGVGPAWLWVVFGAIFFGAVHDFVALYASLRERGCSMAEIARKSMGNTGFVLFITFTIILIVLVTGAYLSLTAISLTSLYPLTSLGLEPSQTLLRTQIVNGQTTGVIGGIASMSVIVVTIVAPLLGYLFLRRHMKTWLAYIVASAICAVSIWLGFLYPVTMDPSLWKVILAVYTLVACQLPVWWIIQPRDFVNVQILYAGMAAMAVGLVVAGFQGAQVVYPVASVAEGAAKAGGPIWPFLFITIACGAISGFHCLVSGGTSSKQLAKEQQARAIGYGGMLTEGLLAVLVIVTVGSALSYGDYMNIVWPAEGAGNPILAFALAMGHLMHNTFGMSVAFGAVMGILVVEGFLITTLDTAVRLNRYLLQELWGTIFATPPAIFKQYWFNSILAVGLMLTLAMKDSYKAIWPLFGSTNQLLAALALIAVSVWLHRAGRRVWYTMIPAVAMIITTIVALTYTLITNYIPKGNTLLASTDILLLGLALGVLWLSVKHFLAAQHKAQTATSA
jgi:carbon starvation protein